MTLFETYMRAMRPFTQPYCAALEAFAAFLNTGARKAPEIEPARAAPLRYSADVTEAVQGRAQPFGAARDPVKKDLVSPLAPASPRSAKTAITHAAAVERANRAWATRRANAAEDEKAARKAARQRGRARKSR